MADPVVPVTAADPASAPAAPAPNIITGDPSPADPKAAPAGDWPDDWRTKLSGGDEKNLKQLERYASPADIWKKARALEQRMSSGELKANIPFPDKGTPAEQTAWRAEQGVPENPDAYLEKLPDGLVIGENDKETMTEFAARMHAKNAPPGLVHEAIAGYYAAQEKAVALRATQDASAKQETEDALRGEWGNDYRQNVTRIQNFLGTLPEGLRDRMMNARLSDGRPMFADAESVRFFMGVVNELEPTVSLVPNSGGNQGEAIASEIANLKKLMGDGNSEYWKGPNAAKMQERYRKLVDGQSKLEKKAA